MVKYYVYMYIILFVLKPFTIIKRLKTKSMAIYESAECQ